MNHLSWLTLDKTEMNKMFATELENISIFGFHSKAFIEKNFGDSFFKPKLCVYL